MPTYRAYVLNTAGKIVWGDWIEAADQAAAELKAREMCGQGAPTVELWLGTRQVADLECEPSNSDKRSARKPDGLT